MTRVGTTGLVFSDALCFCAPQTAFDAVKYYTGKTNTLRGTGVFSFIKKERAGCAAKAVGSTAKKVGAPRGVPAAEGKSAAKQKATAS